ncbi:PhzF family phenazine biosynthesis protein [Pseudokineococcus sp. 5B2Z-1]|uniref:PhzF family phenazine biosynthesis protein n=1 Tax=Pseudokineococcus sp. 5B2Z-1 TaxID=3132744 RepID=UPI0030994B73
MRPFTQVDVFTDEPAPGLGNPVAVVHDAAGLDDAAMQRFARWTNLSETTFLLPPEDPSADYRLRIFTPARELPFAGHPTLGSARAWLEAGGRPRGEHVVQECGAGLVRVRRDPDVAGRLAFAAPPLVRSGPVDADLLDRLRRGLGLAADDVVDAAWTDNGPGWVSLLLRDADAVLAVRPDWSALDGLDVGLVGPHVGGGPATVEVRAFAMASVAAEDPVTGSLNAGLAQWLQASGRVPAAYTAAQGTALGRRGRVHVQRVGEDVWVGGGTVVGVSGRALV